MMTVGKAGSIGWKTIGLYLATTVMASILGILSIVSFKGLFEQGEFTPSSPATVSLGCNDPDTFLAEMDNGTVVCTADYFDETDKTFTIIDLNGNFMTKSSGPVWGISLSSSPSWLSRTFLHRSSVRTLLLLSSLPSSLALLSPRSTTTRKLPALPSWISSGN